MAKSRKTDTKAGAWRQSGYFKWSRDPAMGLFSVLPLWLFYICLRWQLAPDERNGAEILLLQQFSKLGEYAHFFLSAVIALMMTVAAASLVKNKVPWSRVASVIALEGVVYGVMLGPIAREMTSSADRLLSMAPPSSSLAGDLVGSMGAGIFEELVFRLGLMSLLVWLGMRGVRSWGLPKWVAGLFAIAGSALAFSWFHQLCGEPYERSTFMFRTMAGVLLGVLMWVRGYGVCVYTHTAYNMYFYLRL